MLRVCEGRAGKEPSGERARVKRESDGVFTGTSGEGVWGRAVCHPRCRQMVASKGARAPVPRGDRGRRSVKDGPAIAGPGST